MELGESRYGAKDFVPAGTSDSVRPGTFYLTKVDALYRRFYARKPTVTSIENGNGHGLKAAATAAPTNGVNGNGIKH